MKTFKLFVVTAIVSLLAACTDGKPGEAAGPAEPPHPVAGATSPEKTSDTTPEPPADVPRDQYTDAASVGGKEFFTVVYLSRAKTATDEDKLNTLAPGYFAEMDTFKKADIKEKELPRINELLGRARAASFFVTGPAVMLDSVDSYVMASKSFPLYSCTHNGWVAAGDKHNTNLVVQTPKSMCAVAVPDEGLARQIEERRNKGEMRVESKDYFRVDSVDEGQGRGHGTMMHRHVELIWEPIGKPRQVLVTADLP
jgi:hypothetical protein